MPFAKKVMALAALNSEFFFSLEAESKRRDRAAPKDMREVDLNDRSPAIFQL